LGIGDMGDNYSHTSKRYEYLNLYSDDAADAAAAAE